MPEILHRLLMLQKMGLRCGYALYPVSTMAFMMMWAHQISMELRAKENDLLQALDHLPVSLVR
jgi:hypothetical protein